MTIDPVALVETARTFDGDLASWATALMSHLAVAFEGGRAVAVGVVCAKGNVIATGAAPRRARAGGGCAERWMKEHAAELRMAAPSCGASTLGAGRCAGAADVWLLTVPTQPAVVFAVAVEERVRIDACDRRFWRRVAIHLAALGRRGVRGASPNPSSAPNSPRAISPPITPNPPSTLGTHVSQAQVGLRDAIRHWDHACASGRREGGGAQGALEIWYGLLMGRWSLVDRFDTDGRRYLVARGGSVQPKERLTQRQRQVMFHASLGCANGEIGHALGLADNTVSAHLHRGLNKIGTISRTDWVRLSTRVTSAVALDSLGAA